ncbi:MAG TPA: TonB-dependent receptor [Vicinamibacterales bacterium]|nr:TonB-dependent receptor [Vicinamibacterales bacterium]
MFSVLLSVVLLQAAGAQATISGVVRDSGGAVVVGATVIAQAPTRATSQTQTGTDGRFTIARPTGRFVLVVRASGFSEWRHEWPEGQSGVEVVLSPAGVLETVTVTPARSEVRLGDVPASMSVLSREEIRQSPAVLADDVLRRLPSFSLFRRTSSIAAHPTTQGVSLRGIGPSGVSRTLVLLDGVPFNDPFGGWVYWSRIPLEQAERIEVVDGTGSSLYGNYALGGVINIVTAPATARAFEVKAQYGSLDSRALDASGSGVLGSMGFTVDGGLFRTDGYSPVIAVNRAGLAERGLVDNKVSLDMHRVNVRLDFNPAGRARGLLRAGYFNEERNNGKHSTINGASEENDTTWTSASAGVTVRLLGNSELQASASLGGGTLHSNNLAVPTANPPRSIGRMTLLQRVPTSSYGGLVQWRTSAGSHSISAGGDWRWVDGDSEEDALDAVTGTQVTTRRVSGGTQSGLGIFAQDIFAVTSALSVTAAVRIDKWHNYNAHNLENNIPSGTPTAGNNAALPDKRDTVTSPRIAAIYRFTDRVSVWANIGAGFRAPTLNELYRQFRVGTVLTLANNQLGPERLKGGEVGLQVSPFRQLAWRTTWFDNRITDPVSNVTLSSSGANVTQQRQNLGMTKVSGLQTSAEYRAGSWWRFSGGYIYERARVTENSANVALVGKLLPQVPTHRGTLQVVFSQPRLVTASLEVLAMGRQFDDDLNTRVVPGFATAGLPKYAVVSLSVSRAFGARIHAFAGVQNLFDREYFVGTLPTTVGSPRIVTGGVRVRVGR